MADPLGGTPIRDRPGTVRGDGMTCWVKVGRADSTSQDGWVDTGRGERVSDYVMWLTKLPIIGSVPGSLADDQHQKWSKVRADMLDGFLVSVREYVAADAMVDDDTTDDDILSEFVEILHALSERARAQGVTLLQAARGCQPPGKPCPDGRCMLVAGHCGPHHLESSVLPIVGDVDR
jgi:hypothetical protein